MLSRAVFILGVVSLAYAIPNVMLFYETLCPDCEQEMRTSVPDAFRKFKDNVFFSLVPYGNAFTEIGPNGTIRVTCQHGTNECIANAWHACSHLYMTPTERLQYAICTMSQGRTKTIPLLRNCTTEDKVALLKPCAEGPMGVALIKLMADITDTAGVVWNNSTRHLDGVPTYFIDGFPVSFEDSDKFSLSELICQKAKEKPTNC